MQRFLQIYIKIVQQVPICDRKLSRCLPVSETDVPDVVVQTKTDENSVL